MDLSLRLEYRRTINVYHGNQELCFPNRLADRLRISATKLYTTRLGLIMGLLHNLGDGCRGQNRGRDGRGTATGGPR